MKPRILGIVVALAPVVIGCRQPDGSASMSPTFSEYRPATAEPAAQPSPLPTSIEFPAGAFAIELMPGEDAPWVEAAMPRPSSDPIMDLETRASSGDYAISGGKHLYLLTGRREGMMGSIPALGTMQPQWVGILGNGALLAASSTKPATLYRIDNPSEALTAEAWPAVATFSGATGWDANERRVVVAVGSEVALSVDGGHTFERSTPAGDARSISSLAVRFDGVIVVQVDTGSRLPVYLSRDGGKTWERSAWQPGSIWREGSWILGGRDEITGVLSVDGKNWAEATSMPWEVAREQGYELLETDFATNVMSSGPPATRFVTPSEPPPPPSPKTPLRNERAATELGVGGLGLYGTGIGHGGSKCRDGVRCLHGDIGTPPPFTPHEVYVFDDQRCRGTEHPCPFSDWMPPSVGVLDHRSPGSGLVMGRLPQACEVRDIAMARGLGVIACRRKTKTIVVTVEPDGVSHAELSLDTTEFSLSGIMQAPDGTLVVPEPASCDRWARAWVRRPVPAGQEQAWTEVFVHGARAWRPVGRGAAVAIADHESGDLRQATLWLAEPGHAPRKILDRFDVSESPRTIRVDDGRVSVLDEEWRVVLEDGTLAPVTLPDRTEVVDGVTLVRAVPYLRCTSDP